MKIKITENNQQKIEDELKAVNGRATTKTFTEYSEILEYVNFVETKFNNFGFSEKDKKGAVFVFNSFESVAKSYKYAQTNTSCTIERTSTGWFLTNVERVENWPGSRAKRQLILTPEQDQTAHRRLSEQYSIKKIEEVVGEAA